ncbi:MAG: nitroreductase family protein [Lachnospiraceae bacterium]|nr:nitroreductase family protein [Lachnospiraceae bacterium]MBP3506085.1 nitroreductase family protein [Lachnospiraceae bacterium]
MEAIECIKTRRSCRKFKEEAVPHEILEEVVGTATYAPSWKNTQITRYIVVEDKEKLQKIASDCVLNFEYNMKTISRCPVLVVVTMVKNRSGFEKDGSYTTSKEDRWEMFDAGIATQTFCLAAHEKGLGSVIMGIFDEAKIAEVVNIPEGQQVAALVAIGYPIFQPEAPKRKEVSELLSFQ